MTPVYGRGARGSGVAVCMQPYHTTNHSQRPHVGCCGVPARHSTITASKGTASAVSPKARAAATRSAGRLHAERPHSGRSAAAMSPGRAVRVPSGPHAMSTHPRAPSARTSHLELLLQHAAACGEHARLPPTCDRPGRKPMVAQKLTCGTCSTDGHGHAIRADLGGLHGCWHTCAACAASWSPSCRRTPCGWRRGQAPSAALQQLLRGSPLPDSLGSFNLECTVSTASRGWRAGRPAPRCATRKCSLIMLIIHPYS